MNTRRLYHPLTECQFEADLEALQSASAMERKENQTVTN